MPNTATFTGAGADKSDWQLVGNWSGGSGSGGVPGTGDDVRVDAIPKNITGNTSAFAAVNIGSFKVSGFCEKSLASGSAPIKFGTCTNVDYAGRGQVACLDMTVTTAKINVREGKEFVFAGGTWATTTASGAGTITKGASATTTTVKCLGPLWLDEAGAAYVTFWAMGGTAQLRCSVGTLHSQIDVMLEGAAAITTKAWIYARGRVTNWASGTVTDAEIFPGGTLTYNGTPQAAAILTDHTFWEGSTLQKQSPGFALTETHPGAPVGSPNFVAASGPTD